MSGISSILWGNDSSTSCDIGSSTSLSTAFITILTLISIGITGICCYGLYIARKKLLSRIQTPLDDPDSKASNQAILSPKAQGSSMRYRYVIIVLISNLTRMLSLTTLYLEIDKDDFQWSGFIFILPLLLFYSCLTYIIGKWIQMLTNYGNTISTAVWCINSINIMGIICYYWVLLVLDPNQCPARIIRITMFHFGILSIITAIGCIISSILLAKHSLQADFPTSKALITRVIMFCIVCIGVLVFWSILSISISFRGLSTHIQGHSTIWWLLPTVEWVFTVCSLLLLFGRDLFCNSDDEYPAILIGSRHGTSILNRRGSWLSTRNDSIINQQAGNDGDGQNYGSGAS